MDFSECIYNPEVEGYFWEVYSVFQNITPKEGWEDDDWNDLIRVNLAFCMRKSPFAEERDFKRRWEKIFNYFEIESSHEVRIAFDLGARPFRAVQNAVFYVLNDHQYENWITLKIALAENRAMLRAPLFDEKQYAVRQRIKADIEKDTLQVQELEASLFRDEYLLQMIAEEASKDHLKGFAETYALIPTYYQSN